MSGEITENPTAWYYTIAGDTSRAWSSRDGVWRDQYPAPLCRDMQSAAALTDYLRTYGLRGPAPTDDDARREYQRRIALALGASGIGHAGFVYADDTRELTELRTVETPTAEQTARIAELEARVAAIALLIDKYNALSSPPPVDYTADSYWQ